MTVSFSGVEARLARYGAITAEAAVPYLPSDPPGATLYELAADYPRRGGKAIRPGLSLAA